MHARWTGIALVVASMAWVTPVLAQSGFARTEGSLYAKSYNFV